MTPYDQYIAQTRRDFLTSSASGLGMAALGAMLGADGLFSGSAVADDGTAASANPLALKPPHFAPKAKSCIFLF